MIQLSVEEQLEELRKRWLESDAKGRKIIELQAKLLKMGVEKKPDTIQLGEEIFGKIET